MMPGVVDTHVHLNDPGRDHWEGFVTGTRAAAAGGITTVVDMPLNSIPATTTVEGLHAKLAAARGALSIDVGFWGGVVPGNTDSLELLLAEGVLGFKCFLVPSGVDEFPCVIEADLREALPVLARNGAVLLAHAEAPGPIDAAKPAGSPRAYATYLASRPPEAEQEAIELLIRLCREFRAPTHIVHLSAASAVPILRGARAEGLLITVETCQHYLVFEAEQIPDGATQFKCAPPIRESANREQLWQALRNGVIDLIATDHSPCPAEMKDIETGDFFRAWGGIASLQFGLSALWTEASRRDIGLHQLSQWLSAGPARLAGLTGRKGAIVVGADADLIFFDPAKPVDWSRPVEHRHKLTPYAGQPLHGVVERTILRGRTIYENGQLSPEPQGTIVRSGLYRINHAPVELAEADLLRCCGSRRWASEMAAQRPFRNIDHLMAAVAEVEEKLQDADWLEAFSAHPRIGAKGGSSWSKQEQRNVGTAANETRAELAALNVEYFERFGFIFIICATGKSADEMLNQLRARVGNSRAAELKNAAAEQRQITRLRVRKLLGL
jgi:allantoinase